MIVPDNVRVVLVRPTEPRNVGAAARAMKTMGFSRLVLVEPPEHDPILAARVSHGADEVVETALVLPSVLEAVASCELVAGTTGREREFRGGEAVSPREFAAELDAAPRAPRLAILFGQERIGLTNQELALCGRIMTIPAAVRQPSLNVAQAVMLVLYELFLAARTPPGAPPLPAGPESPASAAELEAMLADLRSAVDLLGFNPVKRERWLRQLRALLHRGAIRSWETNLFHTLARRIERSKERSDRD